MTVNFEDLDQTHCKSRIVKLLCLFIVAVSLRAYSLKYPNGEINKYPFSKIGEQKNVGAFSTAINNDEYPPKKNTKSNLRLS